MQDTFWRAIDALRGMQDTFRRAIGALRGMQDIILRLVRALGRIAEAAGRVVVGTPAKGGIGELVNDLIIGELLCRSYLRKSYR